MPKQPALEPLPPLNWWDALWRVRYILLEDYQYSWVADGQVWSINISAGLNTDGASVPRLLWTITGILPDGWHRPAALVHDFLYMNIGELPLGAFQCCVDGEWKNVTKPWSRKKADKLFAAILRELDVPKLNRRMMYLGVRCGGWWSWWWRAFRKS